MLLKTIVTSSSQSLKPGNYKPNLKTYVYGHCRCCASLEDKSTIEHEKFTISYSYTLYSRIYVLGSVITICSIK